LKWQKLLEEEDNITVKWAQEDVKTLYILLNNNNNYYLQALKSVLKAKILKFQNVILSEIKIVLQFV
jgi:hypothetical protein